VKTALEGSQQWKAVNNESYESCDYITSYSSSGKILLLALWIYPSSEICIVNLTEVWFLAIGVVKLEKGILFFANKTTARTSDFTE